MKVKFEFDTLSKNFDPHEYEIFKCAEDIAHALYEILNKLRDWEKCDVRKAIPSNEIRESIAEIINEHINFEKLIY